MSRTIARVRMTVVFRGQVQGVGFRYTASELAAAFPVSGTVENLQDTTVRLVAEGAREGCEAFAEALRTRMARFIRGEEVSWGAATGKEQGFQILY
jgi:acylphosphatase